MKELKTQCCIAGGGPAGVMLGYLLARQGVDVIVLEKHEDFFRDFRGDTVHPSTLQAMDEMGLLEGYLKKPFQKTETIGVHIDGKDIPVADFRYLPVAAPYIAMMPQWEFLNHLAEHGREIDSFHLMMSAKAERYTEENGRVTGVEVTTPDGPVHIRADLVVGADGRDSTLREQSGLAVKDIGAPIDVFWFRVPRDSGNATESLGRVSADGMLVMINRGDYWQCALPFPKGADETIRAQGLDALRARLVRMAPMLENGVGELKSWDDLKLLTVQVNRLETWWKPGLVFIGDAAHAMSPVGGVGVNLAVQDAIAAARILGAPLREGRVDDADLAAVQMRREAPAEKTQAMQVMVHKTVLIPALTTTRKIHVPVPLHLLKWIPLLRRIPARLVGMGLRPEHWDTSLDRL